MADETKEAATDDGTAAPEDVATEATPDATPSPETSAADAAPAAEAAPDSAGTAPDGDDAAAEPERSGDVAENSPAGEVADAEVSAGEAPSGDAPSGDAPSGDAPSEVAAAPASSDDAPAASAPEDGAPDDTAPATPREKSPMPFLVVTALLDAAARPAPLTMSHGDAYERARAAAHGHDIAGLAIVELPIQPQAFGALRKALQLPADTLGLYDVFPLASHLDDEVRKVAGQFLAAEALWTLEEQGQLGGVPLNVKLDLPKQWSRDPREVHARLVKAGALDLSDGAIETFKHVKTAWDGTPP
ncbi:MAG: hypothetical protein AAF447_18765 [Myxococcota bacterium]